MFAAITPALMTGAIAERIRFSSMLWFLGIWSWWCTILSAHWVWGGGWLGAMGALDFAGGTVVHVSCGMAALVACIMLGKRMGYPNTPMPPHNLPHHVVGGGPALVRLVRVQRGQLVGCEWAGCQRLRGHPHRSQCCDGGVDVDRVGASWEAHRARRATGTIAGLATITPVAGFVSLGPALIVGLVAGCHLLFRRQYPEAGPGFR